MQIIPKHFYVLVITGERVATEVPSVSLQKTQPDPSDAPKGTAGRAVARPSTCYETPGSKPDKGGQA